MRNGIHGEEDTIKIPMACDPPTGIDHWRLFWERLETASKEPAVSERARERRMETLKEALRFFEDIETASKWATGVIEAPDKLESCFDASHLAYEVEPDREKLFQMKKYVSELIAGEEIETEKSDSLLYFFGRVVDKAHRHDRHWRLPPPLEKKY